MVGDAEEARRYKREIIELSREIQRLRGSDAALENDRLRTRVRELEHDNEVLRVAMERFKAAARGRGSADDMDAEELPSTPDGTELPAIAVRAGKITAKDAIAQVSRIVQLGKVGGNVYASEMPPAEVVQWVRVMRGERDSLRARVAALEGSVGRDDKKLLEAAEAKRQMGVVEESLGILENLVGGRNPEAQGIGERMQDVAEAAVVLTSELGSLQRQHAAALAVMAEVEERNRTLLQELQVTAQR